MVSIEHPPVIKFIVRFNFKSVKDPLIDVICDISNEINWDIIESPRLKLHSSKGPDPQFYFGPLKFLSKQEGNELIIYRDSIQFRYNKYSKFDEMLPQILSIFFHLAEKLGIESVSNISLEYVDKFSQLPQNPNFRIKTYFKLYIKNPDDFQLDLYDFIIGLKLKTEEEKHKSIVRLRGLNPNNDENYLFHLESLYVIEEQLNIDETEKIERNINIAHDKLSSIFKSLLTQKLKLLIGMDDGTIQ